MVDEEKMEEMPEEEAQAEVEETVSETSDSIETPAEAQELEAEETETPTALGDAPLPDWAVAANETDGPDLPADLMAVASPEPETELPAHVLAMAQEVESDETEEEIDEADAEAEATEAELYEEDEDGRAWYVIHCYSGYENKVRHNLEQRIESMGMKDLIFDVVVPTEEEIEVKDGKRRSVERRVFPGYILVNLILTEESWYVVRNTPGVTSFVGQGNDPIPLRPEEVSQIVKRMEADAPRVKVTFRQGERVRIIDGPFNDFRGTVDEIDMERAKVRVMVNFFGRETPVELDFLQVEKA